MARILEVISTPWPPEEGISTYVRNFSNELVEQGHDVTIVTRGGPWLPSKTSENGITVLASPFFPAYPFHVDLHARLMSRSLLRNGGDFDLVHCHSPLTLPPMGDWPVVSTFHSTMAVSLPQLEMVDARSLASRLLRPFSVRAETKLLHRSDVITAVSRRAQRALSEEYGLSRHSVAVLGNGVNPAVFSPARNRPPKNVLYVGRLASGKGLSDLVQAAERVLESRPDWIFTLVGRGPLAPRIERLRRAAGIPPSQFVLKGFVPRDRMPEEYRQAGLFVLPSYHEGVPTALLEAMASGIPIVATRVGDVSDIIQDGVHGLLCPPGDPESLAGRLLEVIGDEGLRRTLGKRARSRARRRHTWERVAHRWIAAVRRHLPDVLT